jgi:hypothetical protein
MPGKKIPIASHFVIRIVINTRLVTSEGFNCGAEILLLFDHVRIYVTPIYVVRNENLHENSFFPSPAKSHVFQAGDAVYSALYVCFGPIRVTPNTIFNSLDSKAFLFSKNTSDVRFLDSPPLNSFYLHFTLYCC